jgi:hypothetical protein
MKHLRLMPLLIAAAFLTPRTHAATIKPASEGKQPPSSASLLLGLSLLALAGRPARNEPFRNQRPH